MLVIGSLRRSSGAGPSQLLHVTHRGLLLGATKQSVVGSCLCWALKCMEDATVKTEASCQQCWAWGQSSRGTWHAKASCNLTGACGHLKVFRRICRTCQGWLPMKMAAERGLGMYLGSIQVGWTGSQQVIKVRQAMLNRLMQIQMWHLPAPASCVGRPQHRNMAAALLPS